MSCLFNNNQVNFFQESTERNGQLYPSGVFLVVHTPARLCRESVSKCDVHTPTPLRGTSPTLGEEFAEQSYFAEYHCSATHPLK